MYFIQLNCGQNLKDWRKNSNYKDLNAGGNSFYSSVCWELCHELDILQYLLERPSKVFSSIKNTKLLKQELKMYLYQFLNLKIAILIALLISKCCHLKFTEKLIVASLNNYYELDLVKNKILIRTKNKSKKIKI